MEYVYAEVYVLGVPARVDRRYTYYIPADLRGEIHPGLFVHVPFGGGNRRRIALVADLTEHCLQNIDIKPVLAVCDDCVSLDAELLGLCLFMKERTLCSVGDAVHAMIPSAALGKSVRRYRVRKGALPPEDARGRLVFDALSASDGLLLDTLRAKFGAGVTDTLAHLTKSGVLTEEAVLRDPTDRRASFWRLSPDLAGQDAEEIARDAKLRSAGQRAIIEALCQRDGREEEELLNAAAASKSQIRALAGKGMIVEERVDVWRNLPAKPTRDPADNHLSPAQKDPPTVCRCSIARVSRLPPSCTGLRARVRPA